MEASEKLEHVDVLIVGAGLSGIGAAYHLQTRCPGRSYAIVEARSEIGGTWDLFRYPGIRSDSDMFTLGYSFRPWRGGKAIADGPSIRSYIRETAAEYGIDRRIRFQQRVTHAEWCSEAARWTITLTGADGTTTRLTCGFLYACTGYYDYAKGYTPEFPGQERFTGAGGTVIHPQHWPEDLDYAGARIVVIGSGATAITLLPSLAASAASVTMLQRSPTYVALLPSRDRSAELLHRALPEKVAYAATRWKNVGRSIFYYELARVQPGLTKYMLKRMTTRALGGALPVEPHFTPAYNPWDERLCVAPDGDFFRAIRKGKATVVTDQIESFTETGIALRSGKHLDADIVVTATGLNAVLFAGVSFVVDGRPISFGATTAYKGMMYSDVPNFAAAFGYTNASWTLKCDLTAEHLCRLFNHMDKHRLRQVTPRFDGAPATEPMVGLKSGYIRRALGGLPRQGRRAPWRVHQNYLKDLLTFRFGRVADEGLEFR
jgi:cation diffusion facilitator CzcD-associated flavoprotein CzcO